eukprot:GFUD01008500.1.p1 GENE.GFUD01008500.1~~GFUD01008500.1.p1  ORF type:complete len:382 (-),score=86.66 GFUD01008500.1:163-1308(-)
MSSLSIQTLLLVEKNIENGSGSAWTSICEVMGSPVKHWGVLLKITDCDGDQMNKLVDAGDNQGKLWCRMVDWVTVKPKWKDAAGYSEKPFPMESTIPYEETELEEFLENFNSRKKDYRMIFNNCHEFVRELLNTLDLGYILSQMYSLKQMMVSTVKWSANSGVSASARPALQFIGTKILEAGGGALTAEAMKSISLIGGGSINFLKELVATKTGAILKEEGKRLILSATGEMIERMINGMIGAFTWWQLLQIPVEIGTKLLLESKWFKDISGVEYDPDEVYRITKYNSIITAATVGGVVAGPAGIGGAIAMWFAAEIVTFGLRVLCGWISSFFTKDGSDYFDQWIGPSKTLSILKKIFGGSEDALNFMIKYMNTTQKKKLM